MIGKIKKNVDFQIIAPLEGRGNILEFIDENEDAFMEININEQDERFLTVYKTENHIMISLSDIEKRIEISKRKIINIDPQELE